jgi:hypothetical protein
MKSTTYNPGDKILLERTTIEKGMSRKNNIITVQTPGIYHISCNIEAIPPCSFLIRINDLSQSEYMFGNSWLPTASSRNVERVNVSCSIIADIPAGSTVYINAEYKSVIENVTTVGNVVTALTLFKIA